MDIVGKKKDGEFGIIPRMHNTFPKNMKQYI